MFKLIPSARAALIGTVGVLGLCATGALFPSFAQDAESNFCSQLLTAHPDGGGNLTAEVQALVAASPDVAGDIHGCACPAEGADVSVLPNAGQSQAIGKGLANAIKKINNPDLVDELKQMVAQSCSKDLKTAFLNNAGEETAAIDDGSGDGGAPVGGGPAAPVLTVGSSGGGTGGGTVSPN